MFSRIMAALVVVLLSGSAWAENPSERPSPIDSYSKHELKQAISELFKENGKLIEGCSDSDGIRALNTPQCQEAFDYFQGMMMEYGEILYCAHC